MADKDAGPAQAKAAASAAEAAAKAPKGNPVFKMMGLPNFRLKLPSRNWSIFLTIVGSWTAAVVYDRREKKKIQQKWCKLVADLASEPMPTNTLARKLTVYVEAPPGDGLMAARDHFHEYVKPILVVAALDWDAVEGRREGDIRAGLAEKIRKMRKLKGERTGTPLEDDAETAVLATRVRSGIKPVEAVAGDIVIGRHTWKEYVRGLHEGYLGPLDPPATASPTVEPPTIPSISESQPVQDGSLEAAPKVVHSSTPAEADSGASPSLTSDSEKDSSKKADEKPAEDAEKSKKKKQLPPFDSPSDYPTSSLAPTIPHELAPSVPVPFPHILGFLNTPIRMYRFLNRRKLADDVGRQTAAAVLAVYRPYHSAAEGPTFASESGIDSEDGEDGKSEIETVLKREEKEWHKSVRDRSKDEGRERTWLDDIVLDARIAERMRRFELEPEQELRAKEIAAKAEPWWKEVWSSWVGEPNSEDDM